MITVTEFARRTGKSVALIRRYCEHGRIKAKKVGPIWLLSASAKLPDRKKR